MITEAQIKDAEKIEEEAHKQYSLAHSEVVRLKRKFAFEKFNVRAGSIVRRRDGAIFKIEAVDIGWHPRSPWLKGLKQKKDGTYMDKSQHVFDGWEVIDP